MTGFRHLAVLDFEATCDDAPDESGFDVARQEIIELPVGLVSVVEREVVDTFNTFVRPTDQPELTPFCTELTSITQEDVDDAPTIDEAIENLEAWFRHHELTGANCLIVTCGDWDLKTMWPKQARLIDDLRTPALFRRWCNLKVPFSRFVGRGRSGMMAMLRQAGIEHVGHHHRGADDVRNLCNLVIHLLENDVAVQPTAR